MKLYAPVKVGSKTSVHHTIAELSGGYNGLFRANVVDVYEHMPHLSSLLDSIPAEVDIDQYEIDIKVHMLMKNQYPCIPNWHCDNVPRNEKTGATDYTLAEQLVDKSEPPMFLWVSGTPCTEFLSRDVVVDGVSSHGDVAEFLHGMLSKETPFDDNTITTLIEPQQWYSINRLTPHRGSISNQNQWRVFCRLTHKSCLPTRTVHSVIRRHSQVYLDSSLFEW